MPRQQVEGAGPVRVLRLADAHDVRTVKQLHAAAREALAAGGDVVADATGVAHLDTAALQVLIALRRGLEARGAALRLSEVPESVRAFLRQAGLESEVMGAATGGPTGPDAAVPAHSEVTT